MPSGPSTNDTYNLGLRTWKWNGEAWALQPLTGGFTGSAGAIGYTGSAGAGGSSGAIGYTGSQGVFNTDTNVPSLSIDNIGTTSPATSLHIAAQIPKIRLELQEHLMVLKIKQHMEENLQDSLFLDLEILAVVLK